MVAREAALTMLVRPIVADDGATALRLLATSGSLASARAGEGAREAATDYYLAEIEHYLYAATRRSISAPLPIDCPSFDG